MFTTSTVPTVEKRSMDSRLLGRFHTPEDLLDSLGLFSLLSMSELLWQQDTAVLTLIGRRLTTTTFTFATNAGQLLTIWHRSSSHCIATLLQMNE